MQILFGLVTRLLLLVTGLAVAAGLLVVVTLFAAVWSLRFAWARLTGRPVMPFVMRVDPRAGFERMRRRKRQEAPAVRPGGALADVSDVEAKPPRDA